MKKFLTDGKEIRRRIISAGYESVADWARQSGVSVAMVFNQINGRIPASRTFLSALQKTNIEYNTKEIKNGAKIHRRTNRRNQKTVKAGAKAIQNTKAVKSGHKPNSIQTQTIQIRTVTGGEQ